MRFFARIRRHSTIDKQWRRYPRIGGLVHGVRFGFDANGQFVSGELNSEQISKLRGHPDMEIEGFGALPDMPPAVLKTETGAITPPLATSGNLFDVPKRRGRPPGTGKNQLMGRSE